MRMCIPTNDSQGQLSEVCDHFGSAPYFTIYDVEVDACQVVKNFDHDHEHGTCHPMDNLRQTGIDCVVCRGLGVRALHALGELGIRVLRTDCSTVKEVVESFSDGQLEEIGPENACRDHKCH